MTDCKHFPCIAGDCDCDLKTERTTGEQPARLTSHRSGPPFQGTPCFNSGPIPEDGGHHFDDNYDDDPNEGCTNKGGHEFVEEDTGERPEGRSYCQWCGADGDA
jgi:hypothetical protein